LTQEIAADVKQKRLPANSRNALLHKIEDTVEEKFPLLPAKFSDTLTADYVAKFREEAVVRLRRLREQLEQTHAALQAPFDVNAAILSQMRELDEQASKLAGEILPMAQQVRLQPL